MNTHIISAQQFNRLTVSEQIEALKPVKKDHNWHNFNLDRSSRHIRRLEAMAEYNESLGVEPGMILWALPSNWK